MKFSQSSQIFLKSQAIFPAKIFIFMNSSSSSYACFFPDELFFGKISKHFVFFIIIFLLSHEKTKKKLKRTKKACENNRKFLLIPSGKFFTSLGKISPVVNHHLLTW
jgi:hypothetical protein